MIKSLLINVIILCTTTAGFAQADFAAPSTAIHERCETKQDTLPTPPTYAPGTAKIRGSVTAVDSSATNFILKIEIQNVLGYGAATPPLVSNQQIMVNATSHSTAKIPLNSGQKLIMVLQHAGPAMGEQTPGSEWRLIEFIKDNSSQ